MLFVLAFQEVGGCYALLHLIPADNVVSSGSEWLQ
jgi:hypothetical protein